MEVVINLIKKTITKNEWAVEVPTIEKTEILAREKSVTRSEFYQAAQNRMNIAHIFVLSNYLDYNGETEVEFTDRFGTTRTYKILKTYQRDSDELELTCGEVINP